MAAPGVRKLFEEQKKFSFLAKAKNAETYMYTRESYSEFPDIWISDTKFNTRKKISEVNPQISEFAWGTAELVEWKSVDGIPLQGVLIKPGNFEKGKRYPVLVYYYRFFSQRLHEFNQTVVNHRPCFPFYASNGYAVFLPDIRFEVGLPGFSATKCLVPGIQKIIDIGVADEDAIALHGHSWSGYQTAFVITQTDVFKCAIAGAPVSNMTSAYSGIRWGSGLARQFQYEQTQSRIGGSLWEKPELYIENSPVFYADRINTPLLIMFGDEDGAVPWYQGIELYLAMRRLEKDCVFLQYRGEPHHPQKYANKLDYSIRMKEYLDHYCKGLPAAKWISEGVLYNGK
jgi:dipeptidyl aminopeptidase/acylaminoacyl peptidase